MHETKIYDCSNSVERPSHNPESYGPKENDIMRGLKQYCGLFGFEYVNKPEDADVIITNDVFPKEILALNIPRVKRMDGVYWDNKLKSRNEPLNMAAKQADVVIFISEYSKASYYRLYNNDLLPWQYVVLNCVDETVYFPIFVKGNPFRWIASASNWAREEKRFEDLKVFAYEIMDKSDRLIVVGKSPEDINDNRMWTVGYKENESEINELLNFCQAFINLSYRDPAPKVVCQAVNCKLPVLYARSGGTPELIQSGVDIRDDEDKGFEDSVPRLNSTYMMNAYTEFKNNRGYYYNLAKSRRNTGYMKMLGQYFSIMRAVIKSKE